MKLVFKSPWCKPRNISQWKNFESLDTETFMANSFCVFVCFGKGVKTIHSKIFFSINFAGTIAFLHAKMMDVVAYNTLYSELNTHT